MEAPAAKDEPEPPAPPASSPWRQNWKVMLPLCIALGALAWLGMRPGVDTRVIAGTLFVVGLLSNAFAWLLGLVALVPVVGPLLVKVLSIGFIWLLNAIGYLVSFIAIRRGYTQDVLTYRGLTVAQLVGIVIGYVLGKLIQLGRGFSQHQPQGQGRSAFRWGAIPGIPAARGTTRAAVHAAIRGPSSCRLALRSNHFCASSSQPSMRT
jgi:hypothetical protein